MGAIMPTAPGREGESMGKQMGQCSVTASDYMRVLDSCYYCSTDLNYSESSSHPRPIMPLCLCMRQILMLSSP